MTIDDRLSSHRGTLGKAAAALHEARAEYLRERFDGYVADTYRVRGVGYVCWPALGPDGRFSAYDELCAAERRALEPLDDAGFERVAVGLSRVVVRPPAPADDSVVKVARAGMGAGFGDGRWANLVEAQVSAGADEAAPVVPCRHCSPRGAIGVYPFVSTDDDAIDAADGSAEEIRSWLGERAPWLDLAEAVAPENRCVWRGRLRTLDYSFPSVENRPLGVPDHVDADAVVDAVDERRRAGEKRDLRDGGGFVPPEGG